MVFKINLKEHKEKEFSVKLLPNIDNLTKNIHTIEHYYIDGESVSRKDYFDHIYNPDIVEKKGRKFLKYASLALVNGEYTIFSFGNILKKFIDFAREGGYTKITYKNSKIESYKSLGDFNEDNFDDESYDIQDVVFENQINLFDIKNSLSLKFVVGEREGFTEIKNIRIEEDIKHLIWDGKLENKDKASEFLKNKNFTLEESINNLI